MRLEVTAYQFHIIYHIAILYVWCTCLLAVLWEFIEVIWLFWKTLHCFVDRLGSIPLQSERSCKLIYWVGSGVFFFIAYLVWKYCVLSHIVFVLFDQDDNYLIFLFSFHNRFCFLFLIFLTNSFNDAHTHMTEMVSTFTGDSSNSLGEPIESNEVWLRCNRIDTRMGSLLLINIFVYSDSVPRQAPTRRTLPFTSSWESSNSSHVAFSYFVFSS